MSVDILHRWARPMRGLPPMTGCGLVGPVLPLGAVAREHGQRIFRKDVADCVACDHLTGCDEQECEHCERYTEQRTAAAGRELAYRIDLARQIATVRLVYAAEIDASDPTADDDEPAAPSTPPAAPAGPANPEPVTVDMPERGPVAGYRFHLVEGFAPNKAAKPVRRALHWLRPQLRDTFSVPAGGDGARCINVVPDTRELTGDQWATVIETACEALGPALADAVPASGRHIENIPF